jgi:hypothetical protein
VDKESIWQVVEKRMLKTSKERFKPFTAALGKRLVKHGFAEKFVIKDYSFRQKTASGQIAIFLNPIYRHDEDYSVHFSAAVSNTIVQSLLVHTELYEWDGGLTWSCGADIYSIRTQQGLTKIAKSWEDSSGRVCFDLDDVDRLSKEQEVWIGLDPSPGEYERLADQAYGYIERWALPFLHQYGFADEALLELCLRNDEYSKLFFLEPCKPLTGMILARHLGRLDAIPILVEQARKDYGVFASLGNPDPIERFERLALKLGFSPNVEEKGEEDRGM